MSFSSTKIVTHRQPPLARINPSLKDVKSTHSLYCRGATKVLRSQQFIFRISRTWRRSMANSLEIYCQKALEMGFDGAKIIEPRSIVTAEWVRMKCQYGCSLFGTSLSCPPHTPTPEMTRKVIDGYDKALLLHRRMEKEETGPILTRLVIRLERDIFLDGYYKAWGLGSGTCRLCPTCDPSGLCKHGYEARPSMESCGIDVFKTARENGFPIDVVRSREEKRNHYGVILIE
jgi:predicted metal-binding protein